MGKIIFGAGDVGQALKSICKKSGVEIDGFCDNDPSKGVMTIKEAKKLGAEFLIATGDVKSANEQLKGFKVLNAETADLLSKIDLSQYGSYTQFCILNCIDANKNFNNPYFLRSLDLIITERCSLKCQDCSNLMQYYKEPQDCNINQLLFDINELLDIYKVGEFRVIGGEPFLNKYWEFIVAQLIKSPKVNRIVIYTNGTIVPSSHFLVNPKVLVLITDYGKLSRKLATIKQLFDTDKVAYKIVSPKWTDCAKIKKHNRSKKENENIFKECCSRNATLSDGKLYECAFLANLARLGILEASCDYCSGRPLNAEAINPAVQIKGFRKVGE